MVKILCLLNAVREPWTQCAACIDKNIPWLETELVGLIAHKEFQNEGCGSASLKCGSASGSGSGPFFHFNAISYPNFYFNADPDDAASYRSDANLRPLVNRPYHWSILRLQASIVHIVTSTALRSAIFRIRMQIFTPIRIRIQLQNNAYPCGSWFASLFQGK